jgi:hypothetical protein
MWQTGIVLLIVAAVLVYLVRHYARVYRGRASACSACAGCSPSGPAVGNAPCGCANEGECFGTPGGKHLSNE